jgi:hypothetical protein
VSARLRESPFETRITNESVADADSAVLPELLNVSFLAFVKLTNQVCDLCWAKLRNPLRSDTEQILNVTV